MSWTSQSLSSANRVDGWMLHDRLRTLGHATTLARDGVDEWTRWVAASGRGGMQVIDSLCNNDRLTRSSGSRHWSDWGVARAVVDPARSPAKPASSDLLPLGTNCCRIPYPAVRLVRRIVLDNLSTLSLSRFSVMSLVSRHQWWCPSSLQTTTKMDPSLDSNDEVYFSVVFFLTGSFAFHSKRPDRWFLIMAPSPDCRSPFILNHPQ